jgi:hypothetical protein
MAKPSPLSRPGPQMQSGLGPPLAGDVITYGGHVGTDVAAALDGRPPTHVFASTDPTTGDDDTDGHVVGCRWINEATPEEFVAVDVATGAAVWESTTSGGGASLDVTDGTTTVSPTATLDFDPTYFDVVSPGGGVAEVTFVGAAGSITVEDEGTPLSTAATTLDFVGAGVTASGSGATKTITIPGAPGVNDLVPTIIQTGANGANTASLVVTLGSAASSGNRIILAVNSNARDVNTPTCTNVTFTEVLAVAFTTTQFLSIYVGVVSGGSSGTTITITATGSNFIFAEAAEVADALTPTAGVSATLTNTDMQAIQGQMVTIAPAAGTFVIYAAGQGTNATPFTSSMTSAFASRTIRSTNACVMCIAYAPGGSVQGYHLLGSGGADAVIGIVAVT